MYGFECERTGCPQPKHPNHYHCSRCTDPTPTSMLGHSQLVDGKTTFTCKKEFKKVEFGTPMVFGDKSGYFITEEEAKKYDVEYLEELEIEVSNLRNAVDEARSAAYDLYKQLDDA